MPGPSLKLPVYKYADVSIGHITPGDVLLLEEDAAQGGCTSAPILAEYAHGFFLFTKPDWEDEKEWETDLLESGFSDAFVKLWQWACREECQLLRLDADGEIIEGLEVFER